MEKTTLTQVRKLIRQGADKVIILVPSKMHPEGLWQVGMAINTKDYTQELLEKAINHYSYYNCTKETGLRVSYWIK